MRLIVAFFIVLFSASICFAGRYFDATEYATLDGLGVSSTGDTWYVATTGSDSNVGSLASPFRTIAKAESVSTYGDHVLIKAGTYYERLTISVSGTPSESNRFKMGRYGDGEVIIRGDMANSVSWSVHSGNIWKFTNTLSSLELYNIIMDDDYSLCRPVANLAAVNTDGEWWWDSANHVGYIYSSSGSPATRGAYVMIASATDYSSNPYITIIVSSSYVTLYGLTISGGSIGVYDGGTGHHLNLDYCTLKYNHKQGAQISYSNSVSSDVVSRCNIWANSMHNWPRGKVEKYYGTQQWATGIRLSPGSTISGSIVAHNGGEGVNAYNSTSTTWLNVRDNIIYDNWSVNVYATDYLDVHNNIIFCSGVDESETYDLGMTTTELNNARKRQCPYGISIGNESTNDPDHQYIYNNIIVGCRAGIDIFNMQTAEKFSYSNIYSNTIITPNADASLYGSTYYGMDFGAGSTGSVGNNIKNNIIIGNYSNTVLVRYGSTGTGLTFNNNIYYHPNNSSPFYYSAARTFTQWKAYTNVDDSASVNEDPDIVLANYGSPNFSALAAGTVTDYALEALGGAIGVGADLGTSYNTDFNSVSRVSWDAGALEYISSADTTAPSAVSTLSATSGTNPGEIDLSWTAVGDDAGTGTASQYDIRWSTTDISSDALFLAATPIEGETAPKSAGQAETMTVTLTPGITYYFAMKVSDEVPNTSSLSNSDSATATPYPADAIGFDSASSGVSVGASNTLTFSHTLAASPHRGVVIGTAIEDTASADVPVTSVTYNGVAATKITSTVVGTYNSVELWYIGEDNLPLNAGAYTVVITTTGVCNYITAGAVSIYATTQLTPTIYASNTNTGSDTISTNITTTAANTMTIGVVQSGNVRTDFTPTGMIERLDAATASNRIAMATRFVASPSTVTNTWTIDGGAVNNLSNAVLAIQEFVPSPDTTAPAAVGTLSTVRGPAAGSVIVRWVAPGDDGNTGTATSYDLRYSTSTITAANWAAATTATGEPSPSVAGTPESFTITGLTGGTPYFFAIKAVDEVPNTSGLSNVATVTPASIIQNTGGCAGSMR